MLSALEEVEVFVLLPVSDLLAGRIEALRFDEVRKTLDLFPLEREVVVHKQITHLPVEQPGILKALESERQALR